MVQDSSLIGLVCGVCWPRDSFYTGIADPTMCQSMFSYRLECYCIEPPCDARRLPVSGSALSQQCPALLAHGYETAEMQRVRADNSVRS